MNMRLIFLKQPATKCSSSMLAAFTGSDRIDHPIPDESGKVFFELTAVLGGEKYLSENIPCCPQFAPCTSNAFIQTA